MTFKIMVVLEGVDNKNFEKLKSLRGLYVLTLLMFPDNDTFKIIIFKTFSNEFLRC